MQTRKRQTWLPALAGRPAMEDWRIICDCQTHRRRRDPFGRMTNIAQRRVPMLLMAVSLSVGAVAVPMPEITGVIPAREERAPVETVRLDLVAMADSLFPTNFNTGRMEDRIVSEKTREEFFRKNIPFGLHIYREARRNHLAPELVAAVISTESDFRPTLRSHRNAIGLMQVLPSTAAFMGSQNIDDPIENIRVGTRYLRYLNRMFNGNQTLVLAAYNAGPGTVNRYGGIPPYRETQRYVRKVQRIRTEYAARISRQAAISRQSERQVLGEPVNASFASLTASVPSVQQSAPADTSAQR